MSNKTDLNDYNEDDFIEENGELKELTVTITLCEYRSLIRELVYSDKAIEELQTQNESLRKENENLKALVLHKSPELRNKIAEVIKMFKKQLEEDLLNEKGLEND